MKGRGGTNQSINRSQFIPRPISVAIINLIDIKYLGRQPKSAEQFAKEKPASQPLISGSTIDRASEQPKPVCDSFHKGTNGASERPSFFSPSAQDAGYPFPVVPVDGKQQRPGWESFWFMQKIRPMNLGLDSLLLLLLREVLVVQLDEELMLGRALGHRDVVVVTRGLAMFQAEVLELARDALIHFDVDRLETEV